MSMITREWLLNSGFEYRTYDGSREPEGEYTLRGKGWIIRIGWSRMFAWDFNISNHDELLYFKADRQDNISIDYFYKLLELAKIEIN